MIVFDVACDGGHRFEGWFPDRAGFERQRDGGLIACPICGSTDVDRAPTAARIAAKGSEGRKAAAFKQALGQVAAMQAEALKSSTWVGREFATRARAMAEGEEAAKPVHGQATAEEARDLHADGIAVMPLLVPVVPPEERN